MKKTLTTLGLTIALSFSVNASQNLLQRIQAHLQQLQAAVASIPAIEKKIAGAQNLDEQENKKLETFCTALSKGEVSMPPADKSKFDKLMEKGTEDNTISIQASHACL